MWKGCGGGAITASREALKTSCPIVAGVPMVVAPLDHTRIRHLGRETITLIDDPHITTTSEAEQVSWQQWTWKDRLNQCPEGCILVLGYPPSVLLIVCQIIQQRTIQSALVIRMPIGFSHAPIAKRQLMRAEVPFIIIEGALDGGLLAATALNALAKPLIAKPNCHCYLTTQYLLSARKQEIALVEVPRF